jgi:PAS domain-containing protein
LQTDGRFKVIVEEMSQRGVTLLVNIESMEILSVNGTLYRLFGYCQSEIVGGLVQQYFVSKDEVMDLLSNKKVIVVRLPVKQDASMRLPCELAVKQVADSNQMQIILTPVASHLEALVHFNSDGIILWCNVQFEQLIDATKISIVGKCVSELLEFQEFPPISIGPHNSQIKGNDCTFVRVSMVFRFFDSGYWGHCDDHCEN